VNSNVSLGCKLGSFLDGFGLPLLPVHEKHEHFELSGALGLTNKQNLLPLTPAILNGRHAVL
jgi:hypothetical protein